MGGFGMYIKGNVMQGEFDKNRNEFSLQHIKQFVTASTINANQFRSLYDYLKKHRDVHEGQILTLYDQMPVHLSAEDIHLFMEDLEKLQPLYHPEGM